MASKQCLQFFCLRLQRSENALVEFLSNLLDSRTGLECSVSVIDQIKDASKGILIFDRDDADCLAEVAAKETVTDWVSIGLSEKINSDSDAYQIEKPVKAALFLSICEDVIHKHPELVSSVEEQVSGVQNVPEIKPKEEALRDEPVSLEAESDHVFNYAEKQRFINLITETGFNQRNPFKASVSGFELIVDPANGQYFSDRKIMSLSMFFKADLETMSLTDLSEDELAGATANLKAGSLNELIWVSAVLGSNGELTPTINQKHKYKLTRWPGQIAPSPLPRHLISDFMRLTGFMTRSPASLPAICKATAVSCENLVNFVNACNALGYLKQQEQQNSDTSLSKPESTIASQKAGLFGKLRNKLGLESSLAD